ncbi:hypothetical protein POJ06DRAFT_270922 [Lipomyces tetrasporus]|uniref:Uncharacterized protein n=1 Tax=Lipomyces tetrasporus TaxID=54092 RepID=A0AAD7QL62_9ASCO|nr:uncharacterized protein POJ06DRAFT_270922 [Lipomyces tetrasporus]KAJ8097272.1 hypothetical protein POJ06DRAFT_270922 [Lipomyces tetrasporus]
MQFSKPLLILALAAPLVAAQTGNLTFPNATTTPPFGTNVTAGNATSNATQPSPTEVIISHAVGLSAQNVAWFSVLVAGVCAFAFF